MKAPRQTHRAGTCLAAAFAVRWSWRSTFPLFGPGTITPRQAVARTAQRMRPISAVGANTPAWRRAEEASLASRMRRRSRPEASALDAARRCSADRPRIGSIGLADDQRAPMLFHSGKGVTLRGGVRRAIPFLLVRSGGCATAVQSLPVDRPW